MHIRGVRVQSYKRFTDLTITDIPETAKLVVMAGPNGSGKSSLFDAFNFWQRFGQFNLDLDSLYYHKYGLPLLEWHHLVDIDLHEPVPQDIYDRKRMFYFRSAYRNQPDLGISGLSRVGPVLDAPTVGKMIENDISAVFDNYQRVVSLTLEGVYNGEFDGRNVAELRDFYIGQLRTSMLRVFDDLVLRGPGNPLQDGSFFFEKGQSVDFHYKNLSGGEKAAFDILLDIIMKRQDYNNTIYCIDEPEMHMHTRLQARLLEELVSLMPDNCQLWIATHSIGMMRKARDLYTANANQVVFLDLHNHNFDQPTVLQPAKVDRTFWASTLEVALDDLANLIAPRRVVLCEGRPATPQGSDKAEFDAKCYRRIFATEYSDTDFISVGNAHDVRTDRLEVGKAIQTLVSGTEVLRVVDRDDRSPQEIADLQNEGVRVLSRRHLEAYLLDDEVLRLLCETVGRPRQEAEVLAAKAQAIQVSEQRGNPPDDVKSASGEIYNAIRRILQLVGRGNTADVFLRDTLAPLIVPGTNVYSELKRDIFNE